MVVQRMFGLLLLAFFTTKITEGRHVIIITAEGSLGPEIAEIAAVQSLFNFPFPALHDLRQQLFLPFTVPDFPAFDSPQPRFSEVFKKLMRRASVCLALCSVLISSLLLQKPIRIDGSAEVNEKPSSHPCRDDVAKLCSEQKARLSAASWFIINCVTGQQGFACRTVMPA